MNWYEIVLGVVLIAVSVLIVVFTLAQEQKGQGLSGAIMGESSATMAAGRERGGAGGCAATDHRHRPEQPGW